MIFADDGSVCKEPCRSSVRILPFLTFLYAFISIRREFTFARAARARRERFYRSLSVIYRRRTGLFEGRACMQRAEESGRVPLTNRARRGRPSGRRSYVSTELKRKIADTPDGAAPQLRPKNALARLRTNTDRKRKGWTRERLLGEINRDLELRRALPPHEMRFRFFVVAVFVLGPLINLPTSESFPFLFQFVCIYFLLL